MKELLVVPFEVIKDRPENSFGWKNNQSIQKLLDTVSYILANEYVNAARENPSLFSDGKGGK